MDEAIRQLALGPPGYYSAEPPAPPPRWAGPRLGLCAAATLGWSLETGAEISLKGTAGKGATRRAEKGGGGITLAKK